MYKFTDTNQAGTPGALPAEAMAINGTYIEHVVPGYRTLAVTGRESLSAEVKTERNGKRDGAFVLSRSYPERHIVVKYQLRAESAHAFREAYNKLTEILDVNEAQIIFNDEPNRYFIGVPAALGDIDAGANAITSTIEIVCADPHKYALTPRKIVFTNQNPQLDFMVPGKTIYTVLPNDGNRPVHPVFTIETAKDRDVVLVPGTSYGQEHTITQDGAVAAVSIETDTAALTFGNDAAAYVPTTAHCMFFKDSEEPWDGIEARPDEVYIVNQKALGDHQEGGTIGRLTARQDAIGALTWGNPNTDDQYGPTLFCSVDTKNFAAECNLIFSAGDKRERGAFDFAVLASNDAVIASVRIEKTKIGNTATWTAACGTVQRSGEFTLGGEFYADDTDDRIDQAFLSRKKVYKYGKKSDTLIRIKRIGTRVSIYVCGHEWTFTDAVNSKAAGIIFQFGAFSVKDADYQGAKIPYMRMETFALMGWKFDAYSDDAQRAAIAVLSPTTTLRIDTAAADYTVNSGHILDVGHIDNDFEGFVLQPGNTVVQISAFYSQWTGGNENLFPDVTVEYRERWL